MIAAISTRSQKRFWNKVDKSAGPDGCWIWLGEMTRQGYGRVRINWRKYAAHRVSLALETGGDRNLYALHSCDNPACVNPAHLRWGTAKENTADMYARGRQGDTGLVGEKNPKAKLSEQQVLAIRRDPRSSSRVAADYAVSRTTIKSIRALTTWRHLKGESV